MNKEFSTWFKIDLHIHSDWSKKTKEGDYAGNFSVEDLHEKLVENDVQIFSLTDHNIINIPVYEEYYQKYKNAADPLLLLGVELDIENNGKTYHSLLIFNCANIDEAKDINRRLEAEYSKKSNPLKERKLTFAEIITAFPHDDFFFIPHAGNTKSIIDAYKGEIGDAQKMLILLQSPMEKVIEKRRQIYNEHFDSKIIEAFRNKDDYAYIEFSDNHNISEYPCTHKGENGKHDFYYIKGSKNYETLRLAFIDPKSRIKSGIEYRDIDTSSNLLESLELKSGKHISDCKLTFSPHMNVIIGGRSSGKSLLMDLLNRSIDKLQSNEDYIEVEENLDVKIKSTDDASYKNTTSFETDIIQINQGDIVNYFERNNLEELARKTNKIDQYSQAREAFIGKKGELENLINDYQLYYKAAFETDISQSFIIHDRTIQKCLSSEYLFKMNKDSILSSFASEVVLEEEKAILSTVLDDVEKVNSIKNLVFEEEEKAVIKAFRNLIRKKQDEHNVLVSRTARVNSFIANVEDNMRDANSSLNSEGQEKAQALRSLKGKIETSGKIFRAIRELKTIVCKIDKYNFLHREEIDLDSDIKMCLEVHSEDLISELIIDGIKNHDTDLFSSLLKLLYHELTVKNYSDNKPDSLSKKTKSQIANVYSLFDKPNDYLEYSDGTNSKSNSPGYNSEKYLQVILNNPSSKLVFIDQPEDNLGNKYIAENLVDIFRNLKFSKQLFLVTHNPAIVVYGDAESIILAKNDDNKISYEQIKLEDDQSQREICRTLDGGEYIFDNRARKYNIEKLLIKES